uniref:ENY2 transcription and export complex 2 subunit n=1 Tax=Microcebus murinus TaxID=30608 RepID=A0A8C5YC26_MICMU
MAFKSVTSKKKKEVHILRAAINQKLIETGERERLKELLRAKLIECGWKDQLKAHCKESKENCFKLPDWAGRGGSRL